MNDIVKTHLVKDGNLIIHFGRPDIPMTRFIQMDESIAREFQSIINAFLKESK